MMDRALLAMLALPLWFGLIYLTFLAVGAFCSMMGWVL